MKEELDMHWPTRNVKSLLRNMLLWTGIEEYLKQMPQMTSNNNRPQLLHHETIGAYDVCIILFCKHDQSDSDSDN